MILLLKDEYRVKGLKQLLGIEENGYIIKQQPAATTALVPPDELANKVEEPSTWFIKNKRFLNDFIHWSIKT